MFLRPIQGENELGLLPLLLCFVGQKEDFHQRKDCAVVFQSAGCLPPFTVVVNRKTMNRKTMLNMSTYPRRNSSGLLA